MSTMTNQHLITPPPELVQQWLKERPVSEFAHSYLAAQAAQWGWDQRGAANEAELQEARDEELEACCAEVAWLETASTAKKIRHRRRPKPPSLKEQALKALEVEDDSMPLRSLERGERFDLIRRALEALPND